jgi:hypothetical protein
MNNSFSEKFVKSDQPKDDSSNPTSGRQNPQPTILAEA